MYLVEKKDQVCVKESEALSQKWRGVWSKYIISRGSMKDSSVSGQLETVYQQRQVLLLQVFTLKLLCTAEKAVQKKKK